MRNKVTLDVITEKVALTAQRPTNQPAWGTPGGIAGPPRPSSTWPGGTGWPQPRPPMSGPQQNPPVRSQMQSFLDQQNKRIQEQGPRTGWQGAMDKAVGFGSRIMSGMPNTQQQHRTF